MVEELSEFLKRLEKSRLLEADQVDQVRQRAGADPVPADLAAMLVSSGLLTSWQAEQMLAGHWRFFLGKYKLLDAIGRGGMGTVYRAVQPGLGRTVALKVMSSRMLKDEAAVKRFRREMLAVGSLNHPNIIVAHDSDTVGKTLFLVMECVDGLNIKEWITRFSPLPVGWCCEVIRQAAEGLDHAHQLRLVHRDIKPSNLLVVGNTVKDTPAVKILDMGLARFANQTEIQGPAETDDFSLGTNSTIRDASVTLAGQIMGSPLYIAPEQIQDSSAADGRADIYGLGVTLFEMLTGRPPFHAENVIATLQAKLTQRAPSVQTIRSDVPHVLSSLLDLMLMPSPDDRIQTPREIADALREFSPYLSPMTSGHDQNTPSERVAAADQPIRIFVDQVDSTPETGRSVTDRLQDRRSSSKRSIGISLVVAAGIVLLSTGVYFGFRTAPAQATGSESETVLKTEGEIEQTPTRELLSWILSSGGIVSVRNGDQPTRLTDENGIPNFDFEIIEIDLEGFSEIPESRWNTLQTIGSLERLNLKGLKLTDQNLDRLKTLSRLKSLNLSLVQGISESGITALGDLTSLNELDLSFTAADDQSIQGLARLTELEYLNIGLTRVSDKAVDALGGMTSLKLLDIRDSGITADGRRRLADSLSECRIP